MKKIRDILFSRLTALIMFDMLLIATPFLMLQNYLQAFIHSLSLFKFNLFYINIPYVVVIAISIFLLAGILLRREITLKRIFVVIICLSMWRLGQYSTDYYMNHSFFELQHNWHYIAYGIFSIMMFRYLLPKKLTRRQIIISTFVKAILLSGFDEGFQLFASDRIFDLCDVAKDAWGTIIGLVFIFFAYDNGVITKNGWKFRHRKLSSYLKNPFTLLLNEMVLAYLFLIFSSILSAHEYWLQAILVPIGFYILFFLILHLFQFKIWRYAFIVFLSLIILVQGYFYVNYKDDNIVHNSPGLVVYKGIPLIYFDILIFPDGVFRFVDKKKIFYGRDIITIFTSKPDILLIGSGSNEEGGKGFIEKKFVQHQHFYFDENLKKGVQIVILKNSDACKVFNELKKKGKRVAFVIHNS